jgi:hypothetical protein
MEPSSSIDVGDSRATAASQASEFLHKDIGLPTLQPQDLAEFASSAGNVALLPVQEGTMSVRLQIGALCPRRRQQG